VTDQPEGATAVRPLTIPRDVPPLGLDVYSLRSSGWDPVTTLEYCAGLGAEVVHFSEPRFLGSLEARDLDRVRTRADTLGLALEVGMGSICPSSSMFSSAGGTAVEQLTRMLNVARRLRSPIVRCYVGSSADRGPDLQNHVRAAVATCRAVESLAVDLGVRIAIENHAGDLLSIELRDLIERAGPHYVGALFDAGNAAWTLEEPRAALARLAPFVLTSGIRDSRVRETEEGATVEWVGLGEGDADVQEMTRLYAGLCPGRPFSLEIILYPPIPVPFRRPDFMERYRDVPDWMLEEFRHWVHAATVRASGGGDAEPAGRTAPGAAEQELAAVETAMYYARTVLGLGRDGGSDTIST
jgi:3-oxoisoapionate decarboxylase